MTSRGDIVMVRFPYSDGSGSKVRPSLVVQSDVDNRRLRNTIVAMITGNVSHAHEPTQFLIDPSLPDGTASGLRGPSVVKCGVLSTVADRRKIGSLPNTAMQQINDCLKAALDLP
jgi:mRNA interferase MazF